MSPTLPPWVIDRFLSLTARSSGQPRRSAKGRQYALRERRPAGTFATHRARPGRPSELDLLRQSQGIIDLDPEIPDGALDLRVSEKQLNRSQIAGLAVDLRRLGAAHRMRAVGAADHPGALDPAMHYARVLASRQMGLVVDAARKDVGASVRGAHVQPVLQRGSGLFRNPVSTA